MMYAIENERNKAAIDLRVIAMHARALLRSANAAP